MSDPVDSLLVDVRANTQAFAQDMAQLRSSVDGTLVEGFARAGAVLERGLLGAVRRGSLGFADLRRVALEALDAVAGRAAGIRAWPGGEGAGGCGCAPGGAPAAGGWQGAGIWGINLLGSALGLPGRATGGPVAPGQGYLVGERGPELFIPASAGRIEAGSGGNGPRGSGREVRVAITINAPAGTGAPEALQLSSRQIAGAVRRALRDA